MKRTALVALVLAGLMLLTLAPANRANASSLVVINTFGATPFMVGGFAFVPLRSVADFLGAALLWDALHDRATFFLNGREFVLIAGSPVVLVAGSSVGIPIAPVFFEDTIFVPVTVVRDVFRVPVVWDEDSSRVRILGSRGWGAFRVSNRAPVQVIRNLHRRGDLAYARQGLTWSGPARDRFVRHGHDRRVIVQHGYIPMPRGYARQGKVYAYGARPDRGKRGLAQGLPAERSRGKGQGREQAGRGGRPERS